MFLFCIHPCKIKFILSYLIDMRLDRFWRCQVYEIMIILENEGNKKGGQLLIHAVNSLSYSSYLKYIAPYVSTFVRFVANSLKYEVSFDEFGS